MSDLIENIMIPTSVFAFNLLLYVVLVEIYEENPTSQKYVFGKGKSIFIFLR